MLAVGHQVTKATTLSDALERIARAQEKNIKFDVAIVDGNLGSGNRLCGDGRLVAQALREAMSEVPIIANSAFSEDIANYGTFYVCKSSRGYANQILNFIRAL